MRDRVCVREREGERERADCSSVVECRIENVKLYFIFGVNSIFCRQSHWNIFPKKFAQSFGKLGCFVIVYIFYTALKQANSFTYGEQKSIKYNALFKACLCHDSQYIFHSFETLAYAFV